MPKLYFRYGVVSSAKTMNLLAVADNYARQEKKCLIFKPSIDNRFGEDNVRSRVGLEQKADLVIEKAEDIINFDISEAVCILVDEAQFLNEESIDALRILSLEVSIICYGLRTDFHGKLFSGSKRLFELADSIEEIKTVCHKCNKKAIFNSKIGDKNGPQIQLDVDMLFKPACFKHWES